MSTPSYTSTKRANGAGDWSHPNGRTIADSGEGYVDRSHAEEMVTRLFPLVEVRYLDRNDT